MRNLSINYPIKITLKLDESRIFKDGIFEFTSKSDPEQIARIINIKSGKLLGWFDAEKNYHPKNSRCDLTPEEIATIVPQLNYKPFEKMIRAEKAKLICKWFDLHLNIGYKIYWQENLRRLFLSKHPRAYCAVVPPDYAAKKIVHGYVRASCAIQRDFVAIP